MRQLELLAPAKNLECGMAAIEHGADAVYIGAQRFGARAAVGNSVEDIQQLCLFAHQYGAKVYVTVNTIVYDDDNTTGVKNVKNTMAEGSNEIYNLSGQRVGKDYKGVVIKNGRKMIQK